MKALFSLLLAAGLSIAAAAQPAAVSLPISVDRTYELVGFDGVKAGSRGRLTLSNGAIEFAGRKASAVIPISAIAGYNLDMNSRGVCTGNRRLAAYNGSSSRSL